MPIRSRAVKWSWPLLVALAVTWGATPAMAVDMSGFFATIIGYVASRTVHDTGQGIAATALGWKVTSFRPYPTTCHGAFGLSCVTYRPQDDIDFTDQGEIKRFYNEDALIIASGAIANHVSMLIGLPFARHVSRDGFFGKMLISIFAVQYIDFPLTATLAGLGSENEWSQFVTDKHVSKTPLIPGGIADYYLMGLYFEKMGYKVGFVDAEPRSEVEEPKTRFAWRPDVRYQNTDGEHGRNSYGVMARWSLD